MADSEVEQESLDENQVSEQKTGFLKSKLFLITVAVTLVLLLAGGGYFLFVSADEIEQTETVEPVMEPTKETLSDELNDMQNEDDSSASMAIQLGFEKPAKEESEEIADISVTDESSDEAFDEVQQQNQQMKQKIAELEAQMSQIEKSIQGQTNTASDQATPPASQDSLVRYPQDYRETTTLRVPDQSPPPEPSWGEFDRLNKK